MYSSLSFLLRESKLVSGNGGHAMYYNMAVDRKGAPSHAQINLTLEESYQWHVLPTASGHGAATAWQLNELRERS